jgi:hypothetical protein
MPRTPVSKPEPTLRFGDRVTDGERTGIVTWAGKALIAVRCDGSTPSGIRKPARIRKMADWKRIAESNLARTKE